MKHQSDLTIALDEWIRTRMSRGDEAYMLTLMFVTLKGSDASRSRQMNKIVEKVFSRILTRLVKHPRRTPLEQMPLWLSSSDWPVQKVDGISIAENLANEGQHLHAMVFVPPNVRTGERLSDIVNGNPAQFLVGSALTRLHVMPIEQTISKATAYALKSVDRGRVPWGDVVVLPKTGSEMGHAPRTQNRIIRSPEEEFIARVVAWSEQSGRAR